MQRDYLERCEDRKSYNYLVRIHYYLYIPHLIIAIQA